MRALGAPLAALLLAASCAAPAPAPARRELVIGLLGEPSSVLADHPSARVLAAAVTDQLVRRDARDELVPRLAEEVPTLENGGLRIVTDDADAPGGRLVATFRIRADAIWHDGRPITAADARFAWDDDRAGADEGARLMAQRVERVEVLSERVARYVYRAGERWDSYALAARVLPRHLLAGASAEARAAYARRPMHAGPFSVVDWTPGVGLSLTGFGGYIGGPPRIDRIAVRFLRDRGALLDALRLGEVDVAPSPGLEADLSRVLDRVADGTERSRLVAYFTPAESIDVLLFGPRLSDARVRRAILLAVDRSALVGSVFAGRARLARTYLVPPLWAAAEVGPPPRVDRAAARGLLASAGFLPGNFGIVEHAGDRLVVTIAVGDRSVARAEAARFIAGDLAAIGIAADVREQPEAALAAAIGARTFDLAIVREAADDPLLATERYVGRTAPWFDVLAVAARTTPDRTDRRALYAELQRLWAEALPALPLYQTLTVDVAARELQGVQPSAQLAALTWNVAEWRFAK